MSNPACPQWEEDIAAYLDGELSPIDEQRVHAHLRGCAACSDALVDLVPLVQTLRNAPRLMPQRDLWPRIAAELKHEPRFARKLLPRGRHEWGWTAAAVVVLAGAIALTVMSPAEAERHADVDTYWHEHALYSHDQGMPGMDAPSLHAVQASYNLDP